MQFYDRLQLKRKYQDVGDPNDFYLNVPNSKLRRPFELQQVECSEAVFSQGSDDFLQTVNNKNHTSSLTFEEEMSSGGFMFTENGIGVQREVCDVKERSESSAVCLKKSLTPLGYQHSYHDSETLSANPTASQNQSLVTKQSPIKGQDCCQECLAGKSGHFHHIGRWRLLDTPSGFCQL